MAFYQDIYNSLTRKTRLCIRRRKWRHGKAYEWSPRVHLVRRVATQFGLSEEEALSRLTQIKAFVRKYPQYF